MEKDIDFASTKSDELVRSHCREERYVEKLVLAPQAKRVRVHAPVEEESSSSFKYNYRRVACAKKMTTESERENEKDGVVSKQSRRPRNPDHRRETQANDSEVHRYKKESRTRENTNHVNLRRQSRIKIPVVVVTRLRFQGHNYRLETEQTKDAKEESEPTQGLDFGDMSPTLKVEVAEALRAQMLYDSRGSFSARRAFGNRTSPDIAEYTFY
ncbi:hypothetical protein CC78DRAFT_565123 [Lojkania enalia]|uniref:Uncharacterized protein n=1 Tax=Lojkania enalia TaxID=147567 RepID=A0A9P4N9D5_9PLEO|nr:hypothetical protein CC78DRAFT_565123 [Didymosphaeria enalia]